MANEGGRTTKERKGTAPKGERFPEGPGGSAKRGDPPLEQPHGDRSRHGRTDERGGGEEA